jgi:hypothetical protein
MALVSLEQAKARLRIDFDDDDTDAQIMLDQAEGIVIDYLKKADNDWTDETVPFPVSASILLVFGSLWEHREADAEGFDPISPAVVSLLVRQRDPALA